MPDPNFRMAAFRRMPAEAGIAKAGLAQAVKINPALVGAVAKDPGMARRDSDAMIAVRDIVAAPPPPVKGVDIGNAVRTDAVRMVDPQLWLRLRRTFPGFRRGVKREALTVPVAPADPIDDRMVFEGATDGSRWHLPRYRLAQQVVSGVDQYKLFVEDSPQGWLLRAQLSKARPPEIPAATPTTELTHHLAVSLVYQVTMGGGATAQKDLPFQEITFDEASGETEAVLRFASIGERDQAVSAITTAASGAGLKTVLAAEVGVPGEKDDQGVQLYRQSSRFATCFAEPNPLYVNPELNRAFFAGAVRAATGPALTPTQVKWKDRFHTYWQDVAEPHVFYILPDAFRLTRGDRPPFDPMCAVRVAPGATSADDARLTLEFAASTFIDAARLEAARAVLAAQLPAELRDNGGGARVRFELLYGGKASFWLSLPGATGAGVGLSERPGAQVDLRGVLYHSETLTLPAFKAVFDAMMGGSVSLMRGEVRVDVGGGAVDRVPFEARFDRMNGGHLDMSAAAVAEGRYEVTLTNTLESPMTVRALDIDLAYGAGPDVVVQGAVSGVTLPVDLAPGASMRVALAASPPPEVAGLLPTPVVDASGLDVKPDPQRIWDKILDTSTPAEYARTISVRAYGPMFDAPSGKPEDRALAIMVQFERGDAVELTPDASEKQATVRMPLSDLVLGAGGSPTYRYRTRVVRRTGQIVDPTPHEDSFDILVPQLPAG
ncbi:hypothetical protein NK718_20020 [Alsobacter sp. SYSU M60028]|uniref:Uncharacterized protein n=1 Tax=Alsobacter ponti TaxID=2962936 RepID=A0ABT1LH88_9HYPH|nr:hypothetical protein [Alsobacter ponti]MCP8940819.1 hypothetical protein [Alsobacter ponti]